jgi:hypothetical protein
MQGADNPAVTFKQVACPAAITAKSACVRANDAINEAPAGPSQSSTHTSGAAVSDRFGAVAPSDAPAGNGTDSDADHEGIAAKYTRCGRDGFIGPIVCVLPYACTVSSEYYRSVCEVR